MKNHGKIPYRLFWTWDHSTNWCMNTPGEQNCGVGNGYVKNPEMFEKDYMRAVDYCAEHRINAIGIAGLLRERHKGAESVRRLCDYANAKDVKIYIIAGLYAYGGIYYEGDHKYSLNKFFEKNPECIGMNPDGSYVAKRCFGRGGDKVEYAGCASNMLLKEFVLESLDWLFKEIPELGGIQMESSDTGICQCPECVKRRGPFNPEEPISIPDMAGIYPDASETILRRKSDALIICVPYHHYLDKECRFFNAENPSEDLKKLLAMPETTFWQWRCDRMLRDNTWPVGAPMIESMKKFKHIMRAHSGTQWWGGRNTFAVDKIRRQCYLSYESGLDAVSMFGETSPYHTNAEFNYLAFEYFADHPLASNKDFIDDIMAERLGGMSKAEKYFEMATMYREMEKVPKAVSEIAKIAAECTDYDVLRRWQYLGNFLNSYYWEVREGGSLEMMTPRDADRPDEFELN